MNRILHAGDIYPIATSLLAARMLRPDVAPTTGRARAVGRMARIAERRFVGTALQAEHATQLRDLTQKSAYWHGTGRYQRQGDHVVDAFSRVLEQGGLMPQLDRFDPRAGRTPVRTLSLATSRLYARCYADMHHEHPGDLNRFVDAQHAAAFFIMRPYMRHIIREAAGHPAGFRAGYRAIVEESAARQAQMPQSWTHKIGTRPVNPMLAFRAGSDIPGNYGILFGIDDAVETLALHPVFSESREARTGKHLALSRVTHIEVPRQNISEVAALLGRYGHDIPTVAIEDFESYASTLPIEDVLDVR